MSNIFVIFNKSIWPPLGSYLEGMKWLVSGWFLILMRPFWGKATDALFRDFVRPLIAAYTGAMARGQDLVTYDAPVALYFYGSPFADPADQSGCLSKGHSPQSGGGR